MAKIQNLSEISPEIRFTEYDFYTKPYIHPIVRGKENKNVEFGAKSNNIQVDGINPNRSLEKASCHFLMTAIRKTALYMLDS